jgi:putative oxidoreductase
MVNWLITRLFALASDVQHRLGSLPPAVARFTVGWVFLQSGWGKIHNLENVIGYFSSLGIPAPEFQAPLVAWVEFLGGALLLGGLATRLAAVPLVIVMIVALGTALADQISEWSDVLELAEFCYIVLLAGLVIHGPGAISLDALLARRLPRDRHLLQGV